MTLPAFKLFIFIDNISFLKPMLQAFNPFLASPAFRFRALIIRKQVHIQNVKLLKIMFKIFSIYNSHFTSFLFDKITECNLMIFPLLFKILDFHDGFNVIVVDVIRSFLNFGCIFFDLFIFDQLLLNVITFPLAFQLL